MLFKITFPLNGSLAGNEIFDFHVFQGVEGVSLSSDVYAIVEKSPVSPIFFPFVSELMFCAAMQKIMSLSFI